MIIEIGHLRDDPGTYENYAFDFSPEENVEGCTLLTPVHAACSVVFAGNEFLVDGQLAAKVSLSCVRCLTPVEQELAFGFDEEFDEADLPGEDATLDLEDIVTQMWLTSIPMRTLCSEECAGLCAQCGKNLNEGPCDCEEDLVDPRLEVLRKLTSQEE